MSKRTKKVGPAGRLGARYGVRIRRRIAEIEVQSKGRHECPSCKTVALTRRANGIWECRHCGAKMASSSYMPTPPAAVKRELAVVMAAAKAKAAGAEELPEEVLERGENPEKTEKGDKPKKTAKE